MENTINGFTPDEIKESLKICAEGGEYDDCVNRCPFHRSCADGKAAAAEYIERLEAAQPKWISVKERLPERYAPVLGFIKKESSETCIAHVVIWDGSWWAKDTGVYYDDVGGVITHWMLLPKPPKEDAHG